MTEEEIKKLIKNAAKRYLAGDYKLFLFGSRTARENRAFSDIDVGVLAGEKIPGRTMIKIQEELEESRIPFKVDLVDFAAVSDQFRNVALKNIQYL